MTTTEIYKPPGSRTLAEVDEHYLQLRFGIQGPFKSGKSHAAASFKNPIYMSTDRGLISHIGRPDIIELPFYDAKFCDSLVPRTSQKYTDHQQNVVRMTPPNRKEAILKWLNTEAQHLTRNQTLVVDNNTGLQAAYHLQYWVDPRVSLEGQLDKWAEWRWKIDYFTEIAMLLKSLSCDVVYICHESPDRDKQGNLNGQIRPLMSGAFGDELGSHFTDWFRAITAPKPDRANTEQWDKFKKHFGIDETIAVQWLSSTPPEHRTIYLWQTQSDNQVQCGTSLVGAPKYILANAASFDQYKRKTNE